MSDQWHAHGMELHFGDQSADWVGFHNETLATVVAERHNATLTHIATLAAVDSELRRARSQHAPLNSAHEAYAVFLEELDEFKAEVWKKTRERDRAAMRAELIQLAAMAIRAIEDLEL